ncbi:hypothetical protein DW66_4723 [Pseudomonas putida]|nr:hypothetical protein DW66_4723 [Pseudomonas putida]AJG11700.1 hypothetical protein RK21_00192 [Pseudomonas plecoglossicida]
MQRTKLHCRSLPNCGFHRPVSTPAGCCCPALPGWPAMGEPPELCLVLPPETLR